jgi:hypothetical protein
MQLSWGSPTLGMLTLSLQPWLSSPGRCPSQSADSGCWPSKTTFADSWQTLQLRRQFAFIQSAFLSQSPLLAHTGHCEPSLSVHGWACFVGAGRHTPQLSRQFACIHSLLEVQSPLFFHCGHCAASLSTHGTAGAAAAGAAAAAVAEQLLQQFVLIHSLLEAQSPLAFHRGHCSASLSVHAAGAAGVAAAAAGAAASTACGEPAGG